MSACTQQRLNDLAVQYNCLYGGKPHISGLLAQIADERLQLKKEVTYEVSEPDIPLLKLRLWFPIPLRGIFARVAQTIANYQGNIFQAQAISEVDRRAVASILFSMPENSDLKKLMNDLQELRLQDVARYNDEDAIFRANCHFPEDTLDGEIDPLSASEAGTHRNRITERIYNRKLLRKLSCSIALKIIAKNQVGLLAKVTDTIAQQGFFIDSVHQEFDAIDHLDIIELLISLEPPLSLQISQDMEKIQTIAHTLGKIPAIQDVRRLGIGSIWQV